MKALVRASQVIVIVGLALWVVPWLFLDTVPPGKVGVRQSAVSGVTDEDLEPGWHWAVPGLHKMIYLPTAYFFLDYDKTSKGLQSSLDIRTKDNNVVELDVSVPVRVKPGMAHQIVEAGNHVKRDQRPVPLPEARRPDRGQRPARAARPPRVQGLLHDRQAHRDRATGPQACSTSRSTSSTSRPRPS